MSLKLGDHEFLEGEKIVILIVVSGIGVLVVGVGTIVQDLIFAILAVPKREDVIATLNHEQWEVKVCKLEIDVTDLADRLGLLLLLSCALSTRLIQLLTRAALIDWHFKFSATSILTIVSCNLLHRCSKFVFFFLKKFIFI